MYGGYENNANSNGSENNHHSGEQATDGFPNGPERVEAAVAVNIAHLGTDEEETRESEKHVYATGHATKPDVEDNHQCDRKTA